jgi:hypothetical protein
VVGCGVGLVVGCVGAKRATVFAVYGALHACSMRAPCVLHACSMRAPCVRHACSMRAPCVLHACSMRAPCVLHACAMRAPCVRHACSGHAPCCMSDLTAVPFWGASLTLLHCIALHCIALSTILCIMRFFPQSHTHTHTPAPPHLDAQAPATPLPGWLSAFLPPTSAPLGTDWWRRPYWRRTCGTAGCLRSSSSTLSR